jgi:hypothetical protein
MRKAKSLFKLNIYSCGQQERLVYLLEDLDVYKWNDTLSATGQQMPPTSWCTSSNFPDITTDKYVPSTNHRVPRKCA